MPQERRANNTDLVADVVVGMSDGLTIPFVLATGVSAAVDNTNTIVIAGLAATVAGAIAMGISGYFAAKPGAAHQHDEAHTVLGLSKETQGMINEEIAKDKEILAGYMEEYGLNKPGSQNAGHSALAIGISYIAGGIIPIAPYFFTSLPPQGLKLSVLVTMVCLFIFGYFKAKYTGQNALAGAIRIAFIGGAAAAAAFFIARLF